ncbi:hypothetical protein CTEN210_06638 [Chaetoceros tenuissimus]|uniref:MYND-type domain-containing protein n=1 Tax=Chaetoceros tenuissimus TaxID=426638 RepID=A0AAD3H4D3_9STRA|nr:hypothetical protein CTEN210_06638 [Chaetoceros tenuissimus]
MISSVEELLACLQVADERKLSSSATPEQAITQLGLPFPDEAASKHFQILRPIYTHVLKDIREKGEESIFIEKILNTYKQKNPDEAMLLLYFFQYPNMVRTTRIQSLAFNGVDNEGENTNTFELLDVCNEIASSSILANFARDAIKNFESLHSSILADAVGILRITRGRSKKFVKNVIFRCKNDVLKGFLDLRKDLATMVSSRRDLLPNTVANAILVQAGVLKIIYKDSSEKVIEIMYDAPNKDVFESALDRISSHLHPYELINIRMTLGLLPSGMSPDELADYETKTSKPADFREKDVEHTTCDRPGCTKVGSKQCQGCKLVSYCGRECQRKDWKAHKKVCNKVGKVDTSSQAAAEIAKKNKSPARIHQDGILADNKNVDYVIVLLTGKQDIAIIFADPDGKRFFRKMRRLAPDYPVAVIMMYEMVSNQRPDKSDLIRSQLRSEYGVDPLGDNIQIDDISSELTDQECRFVAESITAMTRRGIMTPDKMRQWLDFSRSVMRRLCNGSSSSSQSESPISNDETTLNSGDGEANPVSIDPTFDGCWSYDCMGLMTNFDSLNIEELEQEWMEDPDPDKEEWIVLEEDMEEKSRYYGLHVASGVIRRVISSGNHPSKVRISTLNDSDFAQLQFMKKEADELFSKKRYTEAIECYDYMLIHPRIQNFFVAPVGQVNTVISIISNQSECYLRCKDYNAAASTATDALVLDGNHGDSRIQRAQAEIFLYEKKKKSLPMLVQADFDLDIALKYSNVDKYERNEAEMLSNTVKEYLREEKQKLQEIDPQADFDSKVSALKSQCWWKLVKSSSSIATESYTQIKSPSLMKQDSKLRVADKSVDYVIFLPTGDVRIKVRNPKHKAFFRKMRELAVQHSFSVIMMNQILSSYRPDKKKSIRNQLKLEYDIDPLGSETIFYDISAELRDDECALMMDIMESMNKLRLERHQQVQWYIIFERIASRLQIDITSESNLDETCDYFADYEKSRKSNKPLCKLFLKHECDGVDCEFRHTFNENEKEEEGMYYASVDATHDGNWLYTGMHGMMMVFDSLDMLDLEEDWEEDFNENPTLKREDEFIDLDKDTIQDTIHSLWERRLHLATGVRRRLVYDSYPPYLRIERMDRSEFKYLQSEKKEGNTLFMRGKYEEAIEKYEDALPCRELFIAPIEQINEVVAILSNQAECFLRLKDYKAAGQAATDALVYDGNHEKSRLRRAKAEIFLYEEDPGLHFIVQAKSDLDDILDDPDSSRQAQESAEVLLKQVTEYLEEEKRKMLEKNPQTDFDFAVRIWKINCW